MLKAFFCFLVAVIAGTAIAVILALGTASVSAALDKAEKGMDIPVAKDVQRLKTPIMVVGGVGFVIGSSVIVWMFYGPMGRPQGPDEPGETNRSEV